MSYNRKDRRGYVRAHLPEIELPEVRSWQEEFDEAYAEYVRATKAYEAFYYEVFWYKDGGHLAYVAYHVAHSGRQKDRLWKILSRALQRLEPYKLNRWDLHELRWLGLNVAKAYKGLLDVAPYWPWPYRWLP